MTVAPHRHVSPLLEIGARDGAARAGTLHLAHGAVETPAFMPVGTLGAVKAMTHETIDAIGYRLILANTYHLKLRPGFEVLASFGGLRRFARWSGNILTDSGGYQVFSLAHRRTIDDDGVTFASHIDGSSHRLTPESAVDAQLTIGSDIQMVLDVCTAHDASRRDAEHAVDLTTRWAQRARQHWHVCMERRTAESQHFDGQIHQFGIVQGTMYHDLRTRSAHEIVALDFPGYAIGGLSVGEPFPQFVEMLAHTAPLLPDGRPRYVMGIGTPEYVLSAIAHGIDMFDCVFPTRAGRNATVFTTRGRINLRNAKFARDDTPLDPEVPLPTSRAYSRGYVRHLFKAGEMLAAIIATEQNLRFMHWLVSEARAAIRDGRFETFHASVREHYPEPGA